MKLDAETMRFIRIQKNLSQTEFAKAIGCNRSLIGRIETGERRLTDRTSSKIREYFDITDEWIAEASKFIGK
jgi:transcriptional regulator with XRE-family HTH domain